MAQAEAYSTGTKIGFWLFWLIGVGFLLLFALLAAITLEGGEYVPDQWYVRAWNVLAVLVQGGVLFYAIKHFLQKTKSASEVLLPPALAAFGIPLVALGGCVLVGTVTG